MKEWLAREFPDIAFHPEEKRAIVPETGIFLLSNQEARQYFSSDAERECRLTGYQSQWIERKASDFEKSPWWLRTKCRKAGIHILCLFRRFYQQKRRGRISSPGGTSRAVDRSAKALLSRAFCRRDDNGPGRELCRLKTDCVKKEDR